MQTMTVRKAFNQLVRLLDRAPLATLAAAARGENVFPEIAAVLGADRVRIDCLKQLPMRGSDADGNYVGLDEAMRQFVSSGSYAIAWGYPVAGRPALKLVRTGAEATRIPARPVLTGEPMSDFLIQQFETEGALALAPWEPHASATAEARRRSGHGRGASLRLLK